MNSKIKKFAIVFLSLIFVYTFLRAYFLYTNYGLYSDYGAAELFFTFLKGLRFDLSSIVLTNVVFIGIYFFPKPLFIENHKIYKFFLLALLLLVNIPFLLMNIGDANYFAFVGRRSSLDILKISDDIFGHMGSTLSTYFFSLSLFLLVSFFFYKYLKKVIFSPAKKIHLFGQLIVFILIAFLVILLARGGFQSKPLRPINAFAPEKTELGHLTLNTTFTVIKSKLKDNLPLKSFFKKDKVISILQSAQDWSAWNKNINPEKIKPNIIIIALEGLSAKYVGRLYPHLTGYTPFLDQLSLQGTLFSNHFANGRRSMEAFPALFLGAPSLANSPLPISPYSTNDFVGLATYLKPEGYSTAFYHSANYNSSFTHSSSVVAGFEKVVSGQDYPVPSHHNGHWGIDDGPYLKYYAQELSKLKQPFLSAILTLSSHHPYSIPPQYEEKFSHIKSPILKSVLYMDEALKGFFAAAAKESWYHNTLFIITGDHTNQAGLFAKKHSGVELYRVPMLYFSPNKNLKIRPGHIREKITQHADVPATLLSLLGAWPKPVLPFGKDMFSDHSGGEAVLRSGQVYYLVNKKNVLSLTSQSSGTAKVKAYARNNQLLKMPALASDEPTVMRSTEKLKAYIQYFNNQMIENDLYSWKKNQ